MKAREDSMDTSAPSKPLKGRRSRQSSSRQEVRCAVRFPLSLPAILSAGLEERTATTRNVSASGVLFDVDTKLSVGQDILFSLQMPGEVLGATRDVLVRCSGRVVRCSLNQDQYQAAATIDDYRFVEQ